VFSGLTQLILLIDLGVVAVAIAFWSWHRRRSEYSRSEFESFAAQGARDGLVVQDLDGKVLWVNDAYCALMGRNRKEMLGKNPLRFAIPADQMPSEKEIQNFRYDVSNPTLERYSQDGMHLAQNQRKNGELFWMQMTLSRVTGRTGKDYVVLVCRDVTHQIEQGNALDKANAALEEAASIDLLTDVANRRGMAEFYEDLRTKYPIDTSVGLINIDLDRFKEINDLNGHSAGDELLKHVANAAKNSLRKTDLVARLGGDEFVILCPKISDKDDLAKIGSAILAAISVPFAFDGQKIQAAASMGAVIGKDLNEPLEALLKRADYALYAVKANGRGTFQFFNSAFGKEYRSRSRLSNDLAIAVKEGKLTHHFQPVIRASNGEIRKFETLTRWDHPTLGLLEANRFLEIACALGRMAEVDLGAARAAANLLSDIAQDGHQTMRVGINVSDAFLRRRGIVEELVAITEEFGISTERFVIEVPEHTIVSRGAHDDFLETLESFKKLGFIIVIDDFRAGSFGLTELPKLPISGLKISRSIRKL